MRTLLVIIPILGFIGYAIYAQFRNRADKVKLQLMQYAIRLQTINTAAELYALQEEITLYGALHCDTVLFGLQERYLQLRRVVQDFKPPTLEPTKRRVKAV